MAVEAVVEVVEALVQPGDAVLEPVHAARDALEASRHAVEAAVELGEGGGQAVRDAVHDPLDEPGQRRDGRLLGVELRDGLVETLGEHAHLGAVRDVREALADGAEGVQRGEPTVDLVERVEDLLLLAVPDLRGPGQHASHPIEGHGLVGVDHAEPTLCGDGQVWNGADRNPRPRNVAEAG